MNLTRTMIFAVLIPFLVGLTVKFLSPLPIETAVTWGLLTSLFILTSSLLLDYHSFMMPLAKVLNSFIKSLDDLLERLLIMPDSKNVTIKDFRDAINLIAHSIHDTQRELLFGWVIKSSPKSSPEEKRKRELLEKAMRGELTDTEEIKELKLLLEKQREERERKGDIPGAIIIGGLILILLGLLASSGKKTDVLSSVA